MMSKSTTQQDTFVWKKKEEKHRQRGETKIQPEEDDRLRQWELRQELERAKRRRMLREQGKVLQDKAKELSSSKSAKEDNEDWELLEEIFHAEQNLKKQEIRLSESRPQLVDLLAQNLRLDLDPKFVLLNPPYALLEKLPVERLKSLRDELEDEKSFAIALATPTAKGKRRNSVFDLLPFSPTDYWSDILSVLDLVKTRLEQQVTREPSSNNNGDSFQVIQEACAFLEEKTVEELEEMKLAIEKELSEGTAVDTEYWEFLLQNIDIFKSKFYLRKKHIQLLRQKVSLVDRILVSRERPNDVRCDVTSDLSSNQLHKLKESIEEVIKKLQANPNDPTIHDMDEVFIAQLKRLDNANISNHSIDNGDIKKEEMLLERERAKGLEEDEEIFMDEVELKGSASSRYTSEDASKPRKPKYFNRVLAGYEWNKYNQTHYDHDNPPPKTVQGYKFNIFYPNLADPSKAPTYVVEKTDNPDICIIRFSAGPPYQDIAFKIVNREWERSHRKGFKCCFERGRCILSRMASLKEVGDSRFL
ncbi:Cactin [Galdieria sulphuraria]|nr:Cactin [Galdieria sulphuraria]